MFYQNNNDYMRDAFFYSQPQNSTYQYPEMNGYNTMPNNMVANNAMPNNMVQGYYGMNYNANQSNNVANMYPQVYKIIDPVASRVISNNNYPYYTEDNLNNMVDTVYNIVQGDISSLTSTNTVTEFNASDDTVTQGTARTASSANNTTRQTNTNTNTTTNMSGTVTTTSVQNNNDNQLLKDLIKIIIIKQLLSRPNGCRSCNNMMSNGMPNYYDPRCMGMM